MAESTSDKETELTMCDVLQEEQELEDDANAVLGGSDDTNCSYDKGYVPRQALYACKTCAVAGEAGVCLACCLTCHEGHEVVELYTKRNFRCDCGNSKFTNKTCTLKPDKEPVNSKNSYNHNFKGLYCNCRRPYPDLEDDVSDDMIQCVICEDWYHGRHLGTKVPDDYFEMICQTCMESHRFLYSYLNGYHVKIGNDTVKKSISEVIENPVKPQSSSPVNSETVEGLMSNTEVKLSVVIKEENSGIERPAITVSLKKDQIKTEESDITEAREAHTETHPEICTTSSSTIKKEQEAKPAVDSVKCKIASATPKENTDADLKPDLAHNCILKKLHVGDQMQTGSAFWPENWRKELCRCPNCMYLYTSTQCEFLLNPEDTIQAYEERGQGHLGQSQYDKGLSALSQLDRVKQMEAVRAYTNMKGQLLEYLKEFADNKRTVCESDIKEFFDRMGKKQKLNNGVQHFCR